MAIIYICDRCKAQDGDYMYLSPLKARAEQLCDKCIADLNRVYSTWLKTQP